MSHLYDASWLSGAGLDATGKLEGGTYSVLSEALLNPHPDVNFRVCIHDLHSPMDNISSAT
jgi:hypothetical protein